MLENESALWKKAWDIEPYETIMALNDLVEQSDMIKDIVKPIIIQSLTIPGECFWGILKLSISAIIIILVGSR